MSDIFDEVDEILNDVDMSTEDTAVTEIESNFNEAELQDIISEIENLEKELEGEPMMGTDPIIAPVKKANLQDEIDHEIEMIQTTSAAPVVETPAAVLTFEKKLEPELKPSTENTSSSEISFKAHGQMNLDLGFKIGDESAKLTIDPVNGLVVTMNGVELSINQEVGCIVKMENGVSFTIPLTSSAPTSKKKSA